MDSFELKHFEKELLVKIERILNHRVVKAIHNAELSRQQLQFFALQYHIYCSYFPRFLCACAANIPDDITRLPIIENPPGLIGDSHLLFPQSSTGNQVNPGNNG